MRLYLSGYMIRNLSCLRRIVLCMEAELIRLQNKRTSTYVDDSPCFDELCRRFESTAATIARDKKTDVFEVVLTKPRVACALPFVVGVSILSYAKVAFSKLVHQLFLPNFRPTAYEILYIGAFSAHVTITHAKLITSCRHRLGICMWVGLVCRSRFHAQEVGA